MAELSGSSPSQAKTPRRTREGWLLGVVAMVCVAAVLVPRAFARTDERCQLAIPHSSVDPMVFPTKEGSAALDAAIVGDAEPGAILRVMRENGGVSVPHGTACTELERGPVYTRVLVTEGPYAGRSVWAPALHTPRR